jgi:hypothetical protein
MTLVSRAMQAVERDDAARVSPPLRGLLDAEQPTAA